MKLSEYYLPDAEPVQAQEQATESNSYFQQLLSKDVAVQSDAYRTLIVLLGVQDQYPDQGSQYDYLFGQGIVSEKIASKNDYDEPLSKGVTAYMFTRALNIKGGIILRAFGTNQRYAFKELVYKGIMSPGNVHDIMTGEELIITLTNAADYLADQHSRQ